MHNTVDCYDKPGNEDKHPYKTSFQKPSPLGPSKNKNQLFRAWLMKMLEEDSDNPDSSPEDVKINGASIEDITNFIWTITPGILYQFLQSKWPPKALKKTFQIVPKMSQSNQYSPSYQQISQ